MIRFISNYIRRVYQAFKGEILSLPSRTIAFLCCALLFFLPLLTTDPYILLVLIYANIYAIFAVSWDLLSGYTGQVNFGHALFFGVATYAAALINLNDGLPPWVRMPLVTIPVGAVVAVAVGLIVGVPCLRLRGPYLALATLAFPIILTGILLMFPDITGGVLGLYGVSPLSRLRVHNYYYSLLLMVGSSLIIWKITNSKIGIILHAIREDEIAARTCGINTTRYKLLAFSISGFFAGIAGGYYVHFLGGTGPSKLAVLLSFQPIIWTVFGGIATIYGAIGGTYTLSTLPEILHVAEEMRFLIFAVVIVVVLLFMPEGVFNWIRDQIEKECPRCKKRSSASRETCRVCGAALD